GVEQRLHHPVNQGKVISFEKPWEGNFSGYATVIKDGDKYRLYYRGVREAGKDGNENEVTCYAESTDGVNWVKPNDGIFEINGSRQNNVVLSNAAPATHNFYPFLAIYPNAKPTERYIALTDQQQTCLRAFCHRMVYIGLRNRRNPCSQKAYSTPRILHFGPKQNNSMFVTSEFGPKVDSHNIKASGQWEELLPKTLSIGRNPSQ